MGNRAVIVFTDSPTKNTVGVYLHWNGGAESILAFARACDHYQIRGIEDESCQIARFTQIAANFFGGTTSIGVNTLANLDTDNGDNGVFKLIREKGKIKLFRSPRGKLTSISFTEVDYQALDAHPYNSPDLKKNPKAEPLIATIRAANESHFFNDDKSRKL